VENLTHVPSAARNWKLEAKVGNENFSTGARIFPGVTSIPDHWDKSLKVLEFDSRALVFTRAANPFMNIEGGIASFVFVGVSEDTIRRPGTKLTISCEDDRGKGYSVSVVVPATESIIRRIPQ
jgi:hypothetical protein